MFALLALVAVSMAAVVAQNHARMEAQRDRELQLLWVGNQFRQALKGYQSALPPNGKPQYPIKLDDVLEDRRFPNTVRYLRKLFVDPFTGQADWVLEKEGDQIVGLHSRSSLAPIRHAGLEPNSGFAAAKTYADWRFRATDPIDVVSVLPLANSNAAAGDQNANNTQSDTPPPPPPDPVAEARAQCFAAYGAPSMTCRGPSFPFGNSPASCRQGMATALDECLAAIGNP